MTVHVEYRQPRSAPIKSLEISDCIAVQDSMLVEKQATRLRFEIQEEVVRSTSSLYMSFEDAAELADKLKEMVANG